MGKAKREEELYVAAGSSERHEQGRVILKELNIVVFLRRQGGVEHALESLPSRMAKINEILAFERTSLGFQESSLKWNAALP